MDSRLVVVPAYYSLCQGTIIEAHNAISVGTTGVEIAGMED